MTRTLSSLVALLVLVVTALPATAALPAVVGTTPMPSLAPMIKRVSPAIVNVATRGTIKEGTPQNPLLDDPFFRRFFGAPGKSGATTHPFQSAGSGVIFDARHGYILTNYHVIEDASQITVTLQDGRDLKARVVGSDALSDIAVLEVHPGHLTQIALGDSSKVQVGDFVVAIGNPFGLHNTVTSGIVSGIGRSDLNPDDYEDFIQTDASINPGNSGGALVNLRGQLIGINTAILTRTGGNTGIGFAIPVNMAHAIGRQLIKYGSVKRGLLGVNVYPVRPDVARALGLSHVHGALVTQVIDGSAAQQAGIHSGDIITSIDGTDITSPAEVRNTIGLVRAGSRVAIGLLRDGKPRRVSAVISAPAPGASVLTSADDVHHGLDGADLADAPDASGVLVRAVEPGSGAARAGLRNNDVIVGVNRARVTSARQFRQRARAASALVLEVRRGSTILLVPVP